MKAKLIIVLAALAMLFTACKKDKDVQLDNNTLIYDGVTYQLQSEAILESEGTYLSYFATSNNDLDFQGHIDGLNKTFDLTQNQDFMFDLYMYINQTTINFAMFGGEAMGGQIGETVYGNESIFSTGTFRNTYNDSGVTCELAGTLKNGKTLAYKVFVPKNEIQMPPHK